jgi:hypothetical protein
MSDKVYLRCSAKKKTFNDGGELIRIGVKADDLIAFAKQHANARGYVNLVVSSRRNVGQYGDTHSVSLDTYEAQPSGRQSWASDTAAPNITEEDVPW